MGWFTAQLIGYFLILMGAGKGETVPVICTDWQVGKTLVVWKPKKLPADHSCGNGDQPHPSNSIFLIPVQLRTLPSSFPPQQYARRSSVPLRNNIAG